MLLSVQLVLRNKPFVKIVPVLWGVGTGENYPKQMNTINRKLKCREKKKKPSSLIIKRNTVL